MKKPNNHGTLAKKLRGASQMIHRVLGGDPEYENAVRVARQELNVGQEIYDARTKAGLTQAQLAKRVGTYQSVIARMEDADYDSHSLPTLRKIAAALGLKLSVQFLETAVEPEVKAPAKPAKAREGLSRRRSKGGSPHASAQSNQ